ncbi:DNA polymerase III subunit gamma/tau [Thermosynechococcaceae cyanobacterium Okahandja]
MSYEPLHHKYRPQRFADLVGQGAIATTLSQALLQERIAPAYLFCGPRGTGKTSSARILAKSLNCLRASKPTANPCGECEVCRQVASSTSLDVIEIDAASHTGVDNIRELIEKAQFAPVQCRYKVYVIDECHMLSSSAFNALLKTLEEPPPHVVFVLATTDPQRVLPTIISRCQRFDFRRIPLSDMVAHLQHIATQEHIRITPQALTLVAQLAQGGLRDAESMLDQLSLYPEQVTVEQVWQLAGTVPEQDLLELLRAIGRRDAVAVLEQTRQLLERGRDPLTLLQNLAALYRDLLLAKTVPERHDLVALTQETWQALAIIAQEWTTTDILQAQQHLRTCEGQVKQSNQPRLWLEVSILGLLCLSSVAESSNEQRQIAPQPPLAVSVVPSPTATAVPAPSKVPAVIQPTVTAATPTTAALSREVTPSAQSLDLDSDRLWQAALQHIPISTRALLSQHGHLRRVTESEVRIGIVSQPLLNMTQNNQPKIEAAFRQVLDRPVKVLLEVAAPPTAPTAPVSVPPPEAPLPAAPPPAPPQPVGTESLQESAQKLARFFNGVVIDGLE